MREVEEDQGRNYQEGKNADEKERWRRKGFQRE
jgi:hypothetical protein